MSYVDYEVDGHVRVITLNRPDRRNALGADLIEGLAQSFNAFADDPQARAAILTGAGPSFCAGLDLKDPNNSSGGFGLHLERYTPNPFMMVRHEGAPPTRSPELAKPVLVAVNGAAAGGGFFMAINGDYLIASEEATFRVSEVRLGIPVGWHLGRELGLPLQAGAELAMGLGVDAHRALEMGFVNRVVPARDLMTSALSTAHELAAMPPTAIASNLRQLRSTYVLERAELWETARNLREQAQSSHDFNEALEAIAERRPPVFNGR